MSGSEAFMNLAAEATLWRRHLHQYPELEYDVHQTAEFVVEKLQSFAIAEITTGVAESGVVALIRGAGGPGPTIGLRADMDALPIHELNDKMWSSRTSGRMHACGHDGHMAMLLGAAKYLAANRDFRGQVALIFQPAEEAGLGGKKMIDAGLIDRFNISQIFGMHNMPGMPIGEFGIRNGPIMAALDEFDLSVTGQGGHAGRPYETVDPILVAGHILVGLQSIISRATNAVDSLVISVTKVHAGEAYNIIPDTVQMGGTVRSLQPYLRDFAEREIRERASGIAKAYGAEAALSYVRHVPVTYNSEQETALAASAARSLVGEGALNATMQPRMGSEDFAFMLEACPGALIFIGNGPSKPVHNPRYDFNDDAIPYGIGYWVQLVKQILA